MKTVKSSLAIFTLLCLTFAPTVATAADNNLKVVQILDVGQESLDASLLGPNKDFIPSRKTSIMNSLIQFRTDFIPELMKTIEDI